MAAVVEDGCAQRFSISQQSPWDQEPVWRRSARMQIVFWAATDQRSYPRREQLSQQGDGLVGVARQGRGGWARSTIVRSRCSGCLTDGERHTPIDMRLYLPERWIKDPARCERAGVPEASRKKMSKSEHALDIVRRARARGSVAWVGVDGG